MNTNRQKKEANIGSLSIHLYYLLKMRKKKTKVSSEVHHSSFDDLSLFSRHSHLTYTTLSYTHTHIYLDK